MNAVQTTAAKWQVAWIGFADGVDGMSGGQFGSVWLNQVSGLMAESLQFLISVAEGGLVRRPSQAPRN